MRTLANTESYSYGDTKTSALHPASTTHKVMAPEEKIALGVAEEMIRLSVGIESLDDIKRDIQQSLDASPSVPK